jgi:hypothetical protein
MHTHIYIVMGATGEYSDRNEWAVAAYYDEELAKTHVEEATKRAKAIEVAAEVDAADWNLKEKLMKENPFDSCSYMSYTGNGYYIYTLPISRELPGEVIYAKSDI